MARLIHDDDKIIDANDAVRWAGRGLFSSLPVIVFLALTDSWDWPYWRVLLAALAVGTVWGVLLGCARAGYARWAARGSGTPGPP